MKNKIISLLLAVILIMGIGVVADAINPYTITPYQSMLISIGHSSSRDIEFFYDRDTKVMYVITNSNGITPLLNADGTPKLYKHK